MKILEILNGKSSNEELAKEYSSVLNTNLYDTFIRKTKKEISNLKMEIKSKEREISLTTDLNAGIQALSYNDIEGLMEEIISMEVEIKVKEEKLEKFVIPSFNKYFSKNK